jgi:uncharacterized protein (TIGR02444 family)
LAQQEIARQLNYDNEFWRFSLAVYGQAEVAKECLALQDGYGIDVNILLFCAWLGMQSVALNREDIEAASRVVAAWQDDVVRPLRTVRLRVKAFFSDDKFRTGIKDVEIRAEQIEQAMLFAYFQTLRNRNEAEGDWVAGNVRLYIAMKSPADAQASASHLIEAARRFC